ncbi:ATP-dependent endonuclease [Arcobacter lacus]|uniref:ATP-dependent nuclease n=1 Tax=Arcobacter lacus TaxID=1912876 RepID=UPI0021BB28CC|nr:ATP-dependent endonuclease [Arcobacter lacus]MCT7909435.1 ATP-dependent endonuclease [Arcobacter lacus]
MKITNIKIENFRLLDNVEINLEDITTAIVGKNNSGKTSLSEIFNLFMNNKKFEFEDFSMTSHKNFQDAYNLFLQLTAENKEETIKKILEIIPKIKLLLTIEYTESDNWVNIKPFISSLEETNQIKILFNYSPKDTEKFLNTIQTNFLDNDVFIDKVRLFYSNYYHTTIQPYSETENTELVEFSDVQRLLQCHFIEAQRDLEDNKSNNTKLASIFQKQYDYQTKKEDSSSKALIEATDTANKEIEEKLKKFFEQFISSFKQFGFPGIDNEKLQLQSQIEMESLFRNNVRLVYNHDENLLPEKYNGLGYKNLMYIISKILSFEILHQDKKCDLNLLFIEEPEAHMHPQMQTVFIKNITDFLAKNEFNVQVIISTHSSHILTNAQFESIRYFSKNAYSTQIKDLRKFHTGLTEPQTLKFLEQYLTLDKGELFFSDKAILFEGVVERLLMPIFIKKLDASSCTKLCEQYISYIEVGGAYMNKFKELLEFLDIKTLIITDIDSVEKNITNKNRKQQTTYQKCEIISNSELYTSNICLKSWLPKKIKISDLLNATDEDKTSNKIRVTYQVKIDTKELKCGRSFEEAFIIENPKYMFDNKQVLLSIKSELENYNTKEEIITNSYNIQDYIDRNKKKTDFAFDLLNNQENWNVPTYIKEGLMWLSQQ